MELEKVSNIEVSFSEKLQADLSSVVANLCVFAGGLGVFLEIDKKVNDPALTFILVANIFYGILIDFLPKTTNPKAEEKNTDLNLKLTSIPKKGYF